MIIRLDLTPDKARDLQTLLFTVGYQNIKTGEVVDSERLRASGQLAMKVAEQVKVQRRIACSP